MCNPLAYDLLLSIIEQFGYYALFLVLCLGLIGLPIPNEAVVMTGGALAAAELLEPVPAYIMTWLGICSAMSFNYSIGRLTGSRMAKWFESKNNIQKFMNKSEYLIHKYGGYAISISMCLPFLRHATPYVLGVNRLKFTRFAAFAYPSAMVWTMLYFYLGSLFGDNIQHISNLITTYGTWIVCLLAAIAIVYFIVKWSNTKNKKSEIDRSL